MISQEKNMLYFTDFPITTTISDVQMFLSEYKDNIRFIQQDQNQKNKDKRKPLAIKVLFNNYESANKCRTEMNLRKIRNKSIRIMWDERDSSITHNTKNNLFFKGIPKSTTPREVYEYFMKFGDISSCKMTEDDNGNHYGYGYITYYNSDDAQKALESTKGKQIFDSNIEISFFQKRNERIINSSELNNQKIYISNLPEKYTTADLTKLCNEYGEVKRCNIFIDHLGKNFGIVQFSSEKEAKDVLIKLDGK
jgi:polyadenylate-binding protein